jgi:hypothetical protein
LLGYPAQIAFDAADNLHIADWWNNSARVIQGAGSSTPPLEPTISAAMAARQAVYVDQRATLKVILLDGAGEPLSGYSVGWSATAPESGPYASASTTDPSGIASMDVRPGLAAGVYEFFASFQDIHGAPVPGSPVSFTLAASTPPGNSTFAILNADHWNVHAAGFPGPAALAHTARLWGLAVAADGTAYVSDPDNCRIYRVTPAGHATVFAGNGDSCGTDGDLGLATEAQLRFSRSLALDEARGRLYVADGYPGDRVRVIDLATNEISLFAGSGTGPTNGDGGPATSAILTHPTGLSIAPDGSVYLLDASTTTHTSLRVVNADTGVISTILAPDYNSSYPVNGIPSQVQGTATDAAGNLYFAGNRHYNFPPLDGTYASIWRRAPSGTLTLIAGTGHSFADGIVATDAELEEAFTIAVDGSGGLYFVESQWVRRVDLTTGTIRTIAGDRLTGGMSSDYVPANETLLNTPYGVAVCASGHVYVSENEGCSLRIIW